MALLGVIDASIGFGGTPVLESVNLQIEKGERICLLGRNGSGKTTLMKLMNAEMEPDSGRIFRSQGIITTRLDQTIPPHIQGTVLEVITSHLSPATDAEHGWQIQREVEMIISRMNLSGQQIFSDLSAGMKRRVLLAQALATKPDLLMLDEPTNHLDIDSIAWLESFLSNYSGTLFLVTHDRILVQKLATRIIELDRGRLIDFHCNYTDFIQRKQEVLDAEEKQNEGFDKKLSQEEVWIRQGIKARRTRNEGRVKALMQMRKERQVRRDQMGNVKMFLQEAEKSGNLVMEGTDINLKFSKNTVINRFTTAIMRHDRIGIIGKNGCGKTSLLKVLTGALPPTHGSIRLGTNLQIIYFDQLRTQLEDEATVIENVAGGNDRVMINGKNRHVIGYLQDFLFTPHRAKAKVKVLSGGERCRLLLARLFAQPANVLILDEPTNDLDIETLELLEELLLEFSGTLLLVSHDRAFLNRVVTSTLVFEENGIISEYIGGYDDWLRQRPQPPDPAKEKIIKKSPPKPKKPPTKLSFKEERVLEALPQQIEILEDEKRQLYQSLGDPDFYRKSGTSVAQVQQRLATIETELKNSYVRWESLEGRKQKFLNNSDSD